MDYAAERRSRLLRSLDKQGVEAILVTSPTNVTYLSGFTGDSSSLMLTGNRTLMISDGRYAAQLAEECPGLTTHIRPVSETIQQAVAHLVSKLDVRAIEFEAANVSVADLETFRELAGTAEWKPAKDRVESLRAVKDASEIARLREAIRVAERAFDAFCPLLRPVDREKDLSDALEYYIRRAGGASSSFPTIVAVGPRAALPHAPPTDKMIGEEELMLVDWGARARFYHSDLTRVLALRRISPKLEEVYEVVLKAQERAIRAVRPGVRASEVDAEARRVIVEAGFGEYFGHGLGHGLGLQVHEAPAIRQNSEAVLQAGMVITIEPGVYLPGWGGVRIEDDVLVTPDGGEVLTSVFKDPIPIVDF